MGIPDANVNITEGLTNSGAYDDLSGGRTVRTMNPCNNGTCNWSEVDYAMPVNRWVKSDLLIYLSS